MTQQSRRSRTKGQGNEESGLWCAGRSRVQRRVHQRAGESATYDTVRIGNDRFLGIAIHIAVLRIDDRVHDGQRLHMQLGLRVGQDGGPRKEGMRATVEKGALQGETVKVVEVVDAAGAKVLALTDLKHDFACEAPSGRDRALLGYACQSDKTGPVPAKACAKGCD